MYVHSNAGMSIHACPFKCRYVPSSLSICMQACPFTHVYSHAGVFNCLPFYDERIDDGENEDREEEKEDGGEADGVNPVVVGTISHRSGAVAVIAGKKSNRYVNRCMNRFMIGFMDSWARN